MSETVRERVQEMDDDFLLSELFLRRDEYTPEAVEVMEEEVRRRGIDKERVERFKGIADRPEPDREDFSPLDHSFSQGDILLVDSILRGEGIRFFVQTAVPSGMLALGTEASREYMVSIFSEDLPKAREVLEEHFERGNEGFKRKELSVRDRLKAVGFHELQLGDADVEREVDVELSPDERSTIVAYARRLRDEVEQVEQARGGPLFYFDNIDDLLEKLSSGRSVSLTVADLLTILELLQVYCDEPGFPSGIDGTIAGLLDFFGSTAST